MAKTGKVECFLISHAARKNIRRTPSGRVKSGRRHSGDVYVLASKRMTLRELRSANARLARRFSHDTMPYIWWGTMGDLQDIGEIGGGFKIYDAR